MEEETLKANEASIIRVEIDLWYRIPISAVVLARSDFKKMKSIIWW